MWLVRIILWGIVAFQGADMCLIGGSGEPYRAAVVDGGASDSVQTEARDSNAAQSRGCRWLGSGMDRGDLNAGELRLDWQSGIFQRTGKEPETWRC